MSWTNTTAMNNILDDSGLVGIGETIQVKTAHLEQQMVMHCLRFSVANVLEYS